MIVYSGQDAGANIRAAVFNSEAGHDPKARGRAACSPAPCLPLVFLLLVIPAAFNSEAGQAGIQLLSLWLDSLLVIPAKAGIQLLALSVLVRSAELRLACGEPVTFWQLPKK